MIRKLLFIATVLLMGCSMDESISEREKYVSHPMSVEVGYNPMVSLCTKDTMSILDVLGMPEVRVISCIARLDNGRIVYPEISENVRNNGLSVFGSRLFKKPLESDNARVEITYLMQNKSYVKEDSVDDIRIMVDIAIPISFDVTVDGWKDSSTSINM